MFNFFVFHKTKSNLIKPYGPQRITNFIQQINKHDQKSGAQKPNNPICKSIE